MLAPACSNGDGKLEPAVGQGSGEEAINQAETNGLRDTGLKTASSSPAEPSAVDGTRPSLDGAARVDIVNPAFTLFSKERPDSIWRMGRCSLDDGSVTEWTQNPPAATRRGLRTNRDIAAPSCHASGTPVR